MCGIGAIHPQAAKGLPSPAWLTADLLLSGQSLSGLFSPLLLFVWREARLSLFCPRVAGMIVVAAAPRLIFLGR